MANGRLSNGRLNGEGKVINFGVGRMQIQEVAKGESKVEIKRK